MGWKIDLWLSPERKSSGGSVNAPQSDQDEIPEDGEKIRPTCADYLWLDKKARICYVIVLCVIIGIIAPILISDYLGSYQADLGKCVVSGPYTFECLSGHELVNQANCEKAGCCWDNSTVPRCFHTSPTRYTYLVDKVETFPADSDEAKFNKYVIHLEPERRVKDPFDYDLKSAKVVIQTVNAHHLIIQLLREDDEEEFRLMTENLATPFQESDFNVSISTTKKKSFSIRVTRRSSDPTYPDVLIDTSRGPLIISEEYVEMTTTLPSEYLYGLGSDRKISFVRNFTSYPKSALYNRKNFDSFHPFYLTFNRTGSGAAHGVYWDNTNPLEVQLTPAPAISFRSMGGKGVLHLFAGPRPADVSRQFTTDIIGRIRMPAFWSLGLHLCREADNQTVFTETIDKMTDSRIGFDSDCIDLRLSGPGSGTVNTNNFTLAEEHVALLRKQNKKFLLAQPPHITEMDDYPHIITAPGGNIPLEGKRLNGKVFYPSFPPSSQADPDETYRFNMTAVFNPDGIMFVDNYPSNDNWNVTSCDATKRSFVPERLEDRNLNRDTICADARHPDDRLQIKVHNTYGMEQVAAFDRQQDNPNKRPVYLNMASAIGNLGLAGHSGDDLQANWYYMKMALVQVLEMGLFGIPLSGSPICGSVNSSSLIDNLPILDEEQLCIRWYQMGLLLPFAQSLSRWNQRPRSPVDWSLSAQKMIANAIQERYRILPYYYTLLYQASIPETAGLPIVRPLFYEFPDDRRTYSIGDQFMIGHSILVCPMTAQGSDSNLPTRSCYFPPATWYDYYSGSQLPDYINSGNSTTITPALASVNLYVRNGTAFVTQASSSGASSAEENRKNPYTITTALPFSSSNEAVTYLYVDDGYDSNASDYVKFKFDYRNFTISVLRREFSDWNQKPQDVSTTVYRIRILGAKMLNSELSSEYYDRETDILEIPIQIDWSQMTSEELTIPLY